MNKKQHFYSNMQYIIYKNKYKREDIIIKKKSAGNIFCRLLRLTFQKHLSLKQLLHFIKFLYKRWEK